MQKKAKIGKGPVNGEVVAWPWCGRSRPRFISSSLEPASFFLLN